jgi:hypothetical protein
MSATLLDTALSPAAGFVAGLFADAWGVEAGYMFLGGGCLLVMFVVMAFYPRIKDL